MKRLFTLFFVVSVLSVCARAEDTSVTEAFSAYSTNWTTVQDGSWEGDLCQWTVYQVRRRAADNTDVINGELANFLKYDKKNSKWSYMTTTNWEGGIKAVSFKYARYGSEYNASSNPPVTGRTLKLKITAGEGTSHEVSHANNSLSPKGTGADYSHTFNYKTNGQLKIENTSTAENDADNNNLCRILVGDVTITPYIYYTTKNAIIEVGSSTYENTDLIKNIDGEGGALTFSSANTEIATVNETTGVVTGVAAGCTEIIAKYTWPASGGEVTTRYMVTVNQPITETFADAELVADADVPKTTTEETNGSLGVWEYYRIRRDESTDKLNSGVQGWWTSGVSSLSGNYLRTKEALEGGVKALSFDWKQYENARGAHIVIAVTVEETTYNMIDYSVPTDGTNDNTDKVALKADWNVKKNAQISFSNISTTTNKQGRVVIGQIYVIPYIYYTKKSAVVAVGGTYTNAGFIDNTACEDGTLTYETSDASIATISGGVVTGVRVGEATITAKYTWDETHYVTASYTIRVVESNALVEDFSKIPGGSISADGSAHSYEGNYCTWWCRNASYGGNNYKLNDGTRGFWLSHTITGKDNTSAYIETARDPNYQEGGIKHVSFKWHQFGNASDQTIKLQIKVNNTAKDVIEVVGGNASADICVNDQTYESNNAVSSKSNAKLTIANVSYKTGEPATNAQGRVIIGPISITPYLFYLKREKAIGIGERYTHPLLDNTDGEGTITYSISSSSVASINSSTGEVVGKTTGDATVTATWSEGATTTYTLHVAYDLEDNADNSSIITSLDEQTVSVRLKNRTIYCDGDFNTICLPFALSKEQLAESPLAGFEIMDFTNAYLSGSGDAQQLDVRFTKTDHIEAGRPYLISKSAASDITNPVFENVLISDVEGATVEGTSLNFVGILKPTVLNENNLFVAAGNQLYWWVDGQSDEDSSLKSYRAYFAVPGTLSEPALAQLRRASARIVTSTEIATGIENAEHQKSDVESLKTIENGQLIIIRDGVKYNIFGQTVK